MSSSRQVGMHSHQWVRSFQMSDAIRHEGQDVRCYRVVSILFPSGFPEAGSRVVVLKRFSDFVKLHKALASIHQELHLSGTFPSLPFRSVGYFRNMDCESDPKVLQKRRERCLIMLEFCASHSQLYNSPWFTQFFTTSTPDALSEADCLADHCGSQQIFELVQEGDIMQAAALATDLAPDPTPSLAPVTKSSSQTSINAPDAVLPDYLNVAAQLLSEALQYECEEKYVESVASYRNAIGTLLESVQKDSCLKRQASVRRRIAQYIDKAEQLLVKINEPASQISEEPCSGFLNLVGKIQELSSFKVEAILACQVLLVRNQDNELVVIKAIQKSSLVHRPNRMSLLPTEVPFMVNLIKYYETEDSLFLLLEYVRYGQLLPIVKRYLERQRQRVQGWESGQSTPHPEMSSESPLKPAATSRIRIKPECGLTDTHVQESNSPSRSPSPAHGVTVTLSGVDQDELSSRQMVAECQSLLTNLSASLKASKSSCLAQANDIMSKLERIEQEVHSREQLNMEYLSPARSGLVSPSSSISPPSTSSLLSSLPPRCAEECLAGQLDLSDIVLSFNGHDLTAANCLLPIELIRRWAHQLCTAVASLHQHGLTICDLTMEDLLLSDDLNLRLTYRYEWCSVDRMPSAYAMSHLFTAPEVTLANLEAATYASDWWSVGAILYHLATGWPLVQIHPSGIHLHLPLQFPAGSRQDGASEETRKLELELRSLVAALLQPLPADRLGHGVNGDQMVCSHPFFQETGSSSKP